MPSRTIDDRVAANVRAEMARRSCTQKSLAEQLGRTQQALSRRLSGQVAFTVRELEQISVALGVGLAALIGDEQRASA